MTGAPGLFYAVVAATGIHQGVAPFTVSRLLVRAGVPVRELTPEHLGTALPVLERGLGVYLDPRQLRHALARISRLAEGVHAHPHPTRALP